MGSFLRQVAAMHTAGCGAAVLYYAGQAWGTPTLEWNHSSLKRELGAKGSGFCNKRGHAGPLTLTLAAT